MWISRSNFLPIWQDMHLLVMFSQSIHTYEIPKHWPSPFDQKVTWPTLHKQSGVWVHYMIVALDLLLVWEPQPPPCLLSIDDGIPFACISGTYGNFEIMPLLCPNGFNTCTTTLAARERFRKNNTDVHTALQISFIEFPLLTMENFFSPKLLGCFSRIFCSNARQWYPDGSNINSKGRVGKIHIPEGCKAILRIRSFEWFA